ncbi:MULTISPECIES: hypothetical protein [unclassified Streptomyces]|uniref:hypothetical protein n=1 Tax=unclassified Streptomyces TaxID=2593676 RepID=UPI0037FC63D9
MSFPLAHPVGVPARTVAAAPGWPATLEAELTRPAGLLAGAGAPAAGTLAIPALAAGPGDITGIRMRTTGNPPHALDVIAGGDLTPHAGAGSAFARLRPLLEAAAHPRDGGDAEAGAPCKPHCLPGPSTD